MYYKIITASIILLAILELNVWAMSRAPKVSPDAQTKAIEFTLEDLNGKQHSLSDYKGKVVFLNFWATWCPPCREEMPAMQKLYETWDKDKFVMLAVNIGQGKTTVQKFVKEHGYTFPVLLDGNSKVAGKYMVQGIPTTYFVDKQGNLVSRIVGAREWSLKDIKPFDL